MSKCLVTTLQGVIKDDSLLKLGEMRIGVNTNSVQSISITHNFDSAIPLKVTTLDGKPHLAFSDSGVYNSMLEFANPYTQTESVFFGAGNYGVSFIDRNSIASIVSWDASHYTFNAESMSRMAELTNLILYNPAGKFDISKFEYMPKLDNVEISGKNIIGGFEGFANVGKVQSLTISDASINGDIASLADCIIGKSLHLFRCSNLYGNLSALSEQGTLESLEFEGSHKVKGNISVLRHLTRLHTLSLFDSEFEGNVQELGYLTSLTSLGLAHASKIYGNVEDMVATFRTQGRTTGSISLLAPLYIADNVKYHDMSLAQWIQDNLGTENVTLTWDSDNISIS